MADHADEAAFFCCFAFFFSCFSLVESFGLFVLAGFSCPLAMVSELNPKLGLSSSHYALL